MLLTGYMMVLSFNIVLRFQIVLQIMRINPIETCNTMSHKYMVKRPKTVTLYFTQQYKKSNSLQKQ